MRGGDGLPRRCAHRLARTGGTKEGGRMISAPTRSNEARTAPSFFLFPRRVRCAGLCSEDVGAGITRPRAADCRPYNVRPAPSSRRGVTGTMSPPQGSRARGVRRSSLHFASVKHHESFISAPFFFLFRENPLALGFSRNLTPGSQKVPSTQSGSTQSPTERVCVEKEAGRSGAGVFAALTETAETERSEFPLTPDGGELWGTRGFDDRESAFSLESKNRFFFSRLRKRNGS